eukprot:1146110-Pelagomonas_calceolata.AAC.13
MDGEACCCLRQQVVQYSAAGGRSETTEKNARQAGIHQHSSFDIAVTDPQRGSHTQKFNHGVNSSHAEIHPQCVSHTSRNASSVWTPHKIEARMAKACQFPIVKQEKQVSILQSVRICCVNSMPQCLKSTSDSQQHSPSCQKKKIPAPALEAEIEPESGYELMTLKS